MERSHDNPLKPTKGDHAHTVAKAVVAALGGPVGEFLGGLVRPPLEKRLEAWCAEVIRGLGELEKRSALNWSSLPANEEFISTVQHATQIAMRTHQEEKLEALRNAVLNVAVGTAPSTDLQLMFMIFVDAFTPWHLRMLKFLQDPKRSLSAAGKTLPANVTLYGAMGEALPIASLPEGFCEQVLLDLVNRSLVNTEDLQEGQALTSWPHVFLSREEAKEKRTTPLGDAFLAFIESPRL